MGIEDFRFDGRRVLVVGGATGMGAAAAQLARDLGAHTTVLDVAEVTFPCDRRIPVDLSDRSSVDAALAALDDRYDAVFSCAGIAAGPALMRINFIAQRHVLDHLVAEQVIGEGAAVCMISSIGGAGWQRQIDRALDFLAQDSWEAMEAWVDSHEGTNDYTFSKVAMNTYVASRAYAYAARDMRINAVMPGGTDTPLARKNADTWLPFQGDFRAATGKPHLTAEQMGNAVVFLCSDAASGINGTTLTVDDGYVASGLTRTFESPVIGMILGS